MSERQAGKVFRSVAEYRAAYYPPETATREVNGTSATSIGTQIADESLEIVRAAVVEDKQPSVQPAPDDVLRDHVVPSTVL